MEQNSLPKEYNNRQELKKIIQGIDEMNDFTLEPQMTYALGHYYLLLQNEFGRFGIFEDKFIPISKERYKMWSFEYLKQKFLRNRKLVKYEEDGALLFTSYQQMTASDWELFKGQEISEVNYFQIDLMDNKKSEIILPANIISLLERQKQEYLSERDEIRNRLKKLPKSKPSPITIIITLIILLGLIYFIVRGL